MSGITQAAPFFAVPYLLAVLMPSPRWLFAYVVVCVAFFPIAMVLILRHDSEQSALMGGVFFLYSITILIPAMISGFLARVLTFVVGPFRKAPLAHMIIILTMALVYPAYLFAPKLLRSLL